MFPGPPHCVISLHLCEFFSVFNFLYQYNIIKAKYIKILISKLCNLTYTALCILLESYHSITLLKFMDLITNFFGGKTHMLEILAGEQVSPDPFPCCCCCCLPMIAINRHVFTRFWWFPSMHIVILITKDAWYKPLSPNNITWLCAPLVGQVWGGWWLLCSSCLWWEPSCFLSLLSSGQMSSMTMEM